MTTAVAPTFTTPVTHSVEEPYASAPSSNHPADPRAVVRHVGSTDRESQQGRASTGRARLGRALSSRPHGNVIRPEVAKPITPAFDSFDDLHDPAFAPAAINGIVTRGGEHYVRVEGQDSPERVRYDGAGRLRAENGDGLASHPSASGATFRRVAVSDTPPGPAAFEWPSRSRLYPGSDYSRQSTNRLGTRDGEGVYHHKGRRYVEMDGPRGVGVEVGTGTDGKLRVVMDDSGRATGPALSKEVGSMRYGADGSVYGIRDPAMGPGDPSRFYLSDADSEAIQRDRSGEDVDPGMLAKAQDGGRKKAAELRDAAYAELPQAIRFPLPPAALPDNPDDHQIIHAALDGARGMVVGESHDKPDAIDFLHRNMAYFKQQGVTTFFIEHNRELLSELHETLEDEPGTSPDRTIAMLQSARRNGIEIKAIDSWVARFDGRGTTSVQSRTVAMNHLAQLEINRHQAGHGGKWVAWVGGLHASDHLMDGVGIPGLARTTGARDVTFRYGDRSAASAAGRRVSANQSYTTIHGFLARPDIIIDVPRRT